MAGLSPGLAALLCALQVQAAGRGAAVTQELQQEGFHRDLLVKVDLGETGEWAAGCSVVARTHLPPGIYVDPYELASLQQHNLTKVTTQKVWPLAASQAVLIPDIIDVEAPEYSATGLVVLLYLERDPRCLRCFRGALPVHVRYHRPAGDGEEALVALKSPEVLVCCCDGGQLGEKEECLPWFWGREIVTAWLELRGAQAKDHLSTESWKPAEVEASCSGKRDYPCQWYSATHKPAYEELILQVPVGLKQHSALVCVVTLLATVFCSSLILAAVCKHGHFFSLVTCSE
ncbi:phosphatidylinositol-glycan biosynthesis class X protein isoform X1 [Anser cygnoides]|uniref:phosphatidylinositol-glycan biosynthesis class X protein isoform X1 n=1 Tax=Anser cygnoides TaxID=8845 RepID=UPI0034D22BAB